MATWTIPWRVHLRIEGERVHCSSEEEWISITDKLEEVTCDACLREHHKRIELQELIEALKADAQDELTGFCDQCETSQHPKNIKSKRVDGEVTTMCVACWERTYVDPNFPVGRRSTSTSISHQLYCPTCGKGWNKKIAHVLLPRECFRCRNNGATPYSESIRAANTEPRSRLKAEYLGEHTRHPLMTSREVEAPPQGRGLSLINPNKDLVTDMEMTKNMFYLSRGIGRLWDRDAPKPKKARR